MDSLVSHQQFCAGTGTWKSRRKSAVTKFGFYFAAQKMRPVGKRRRGEEAFLVYEITAQ